VGVLPLIGVEEADVSRFSASYRYPIVSPESVSVVCVICPLFRVAE